MPYRQATICSDTTKVTTIEIVYIDRVIDATNKCGRYKSFERILELPDDSQAVYLTVDTQSVEWCPNSTDARKPVYPKDLKTLPEASCDSEWASKPTRQY